MNTPDPLPREGLAAVLRGSRHHLRQGTGKGGTNMKIAVIGGTGMVGAEVVRQLAADGHQVRILSRRPPGAAPSGSSHHPIDLRSREGLDAALRGVDTVIDVANERKSARKILVDGTEDLLRRCEALKVRHYVGISIIGCEKVGMDYYVAKTAQEKVIRSAPVGWSLVRATQFHELIDFLFTTTAKFRFSPVASVPVQPVAATVVARELARLAIADPRGEVKEIAGPRVETLRDLSRTWRATRGRRALPLPVWLPGKTGKALRGGALTEPSAAVPGFGFADWLADHPTGPRES